MKKILFLIVIFAAVLLSFTGCVDVWGGDDTVDEPEYITVDGRQLYFTLEFREEGTGTEISDGDTFAHSTLDGALIYSWEIPMYGATVYESILKFFENREDSVTFRLVQHRFYMFHDCTLTGGEYFNLETVYVAADGEYALCANFQTLVGEDGTAGTGDDLKILTLVYRGWL